MVTAVSAAARVTIVARVNKVRNGTRSTSSKTISRVSAVSADTQSILNTRPTAMTNAAASFATGLTPVSRVGAAVTVLNTTPPTRRATNPVRPDGRRAGRRSRGRG